MSVTMDTDLLELKAGALDTLLERQDIGIAVLDADLRYRSINSILARFNGLSPEDHLGKTPADVLPGLAPIVLPMLRQVLDTGEGLHDLDITGDTPSLNDQPSHWQASYLPVRGASGDTIGILALAVNRTLEYELEKAQEESYELVSRILDGLFTFVGILSPDGVMLDANRSPLEAAGIELADVVGKRFWDCFWWNYSPDIQSRLKKAVIEAGAGKVVRYDVAVRAIGDTRMTIDFMLAPLMDEHGVVTHLIASGNDVTQRKARETDLMYSEERFRRVFDSTADGLLMIDEDGRILLANQSLARMFGYTLSDIYDCRLEDLVPEDIRSHHRRERTRYQMQPIARPMAQMRELFACRKDGTEFPVEVALTPLQFPEGTRVLATVVDISVQKKIQSSLMKALKEKTALLNEVHHRVKNNLQVVSSLLNLQACNVPESSRVYFQDSQDRVKAMALMHQQLYEQKAYEYINAVTYTQELLSLIQRSHLAGGAHIRTALTNSDEDVRLTMDQALPFGLLMNELITNALKHAFIGRTSGQVSISLTQTMQETQVTVSDDGIGIPEDTDLGKTTSLGFQLIPSLIDQLEGRISLHRDAGSHFTITFKTEEQVR